MIQVWQAFSCNNSSAYRLVARFAAAEAAEAVARELGEFFAEAGPLAAHRPRRRAPLSPRTEFPVTEAVDALAREHGFDWTRMLTHGADPDELVVLAVGTDVLVFHPYCLGLGKEIPAYLQAKGGDVGPASHYAPSVSVTFRAPPDAPIVRELSAWFGQATTHQYLTAWTPPPWATGEPLPHERSERTAFFSDGETVGFFVPAAPEQLAALQSWLQAARIEQPWLAICVEADLARFKTIAGARCTHCAGALRWLDRREHAIEADQLACTRCGGMFDLASFDAA